MEKETYLLHTRKLDMDIPSHTLEAVGVNELFVVVTVDSSFTTEQAASGSLGTHRKVRTQILELK
jgi:hypothetical protein